MNHDGARIGARMQAGKAKTCLISGTCLSDSLLPVVNATHAAGPGFVTDETVLPGGPHPAGPTP